jgi:ribonuclease-3
VEQLRALLADLPEELRAQVFTHASWTEKRSDSYSRLAFLGDSVLGPRGDDVPVPPARGRALRRRAADEDPRAGRVGPVVPGRRRAARGPRAAARAGAGGRQGQPIEALVETERVLASVIEAVIGACYLANGYDRTAAAVVEAFLPEIEDALEHPVDFKSTLQERLARRGQTVAYEVVAELGPPHDRTFEVVGNVDGGQLGRGSGRSKKHAEQEAARLALEALDGDH